MRSRRAVFLDRDGTICEDRGYLADPEEFRLIAGSARAVRRLNEAGFQTVVITNQAGVAHGRFDEGQLADVHDRMRVLLAEAGARLDGIYYCPHHPDAGHARYGQVCDCRKPRSGLLLRAGEEMGIDLRSSFMIGDRASDLLAGAAVGAAPLLVLSGYGREERARWALDDSLQPGFVAANLLEAVDWILRREGGAGEIGGVMPMEETI